MLASDPLKHVLKKLTLIGFDLGVNQVEAIQTVKMGWIEFINDGSPQHSFPSTRSSHNKYVSEGDFVLEQVRKLDLHENDLFDDFFGVFQTAYVRPREIRVFKKHIIHLE